MLATYILSLEKYSVIWLIFNRVESSLYVLETRACLHLWCRTVSCHLEGGVFHYPKTIIWRKKYLVIIHHFGDYILSLLLYFLLEIAFRFLNSISVIFHMWYYFKLHCFHVKIWSFCDYLLKIKCFSYWIPITSLLKIQL